MNWSSNVVISSIVVAALSVGDRLSQERGPVVIALNAPGDAVAITLEGKPVGGLRVDAQGRLGIYGPNHSSTAVTVDRHDKIQIDPRPVESPAARLTIADDMWATGALRVGRADAFGNAPMDPNGAIQLGRNLSKAQPMAFARFYAQGKESFRLGTTADGCGFVSDGPHDVPLLTFRPSPEGRNPSGRLEFHNTVMSYDNGTVRGEHPLTRRSTDIVPK